MLKHITHAVAIGLVVIRCERHEPRSNLRS